MLHARPNTRGRVGAIDEEEEEKPKSSSKKPLCCDDKSFDFAFKLILMGAAVVITAAVIVVAYYVRPVANGANKTLQDVNEKMPEIMQTLDYAHGLTAYANKTAQQSGPYVHSLLKETDAMLRRLPADAPALIAARVYEILLEVLASNVTGVAATARRTLDAVVGLAEGLNKGRPLQLSMPTVN